MNDLISRKAVKRMIKDYFIELIKQEVNEVNVVDCNADLQKSLDNVPTAYNVDKVVEQLEAERYSELLNLRWENMRIDRAIDIVKRGEM